METHKGKRTLYAKTRKAWRSWLQKNQQKEKSVWLIIYHKSSATPSVYYDEAVEEALCFGWIDSTVNKRNKESRYQYFCPRKEKSNWSKLNKERVKKMIDQGLMTPSGQRLIDIAKNSGTWEALTDIDNMVIPADLQEAFNKNKIAYQNFMAFSPSSKKIILFWIQQAKKPETRQKRIKETVVLAAKNVKANHYE